MSNKINIISCTQLEDTHKVEQLLIVKSAKLLEKQADFTLIRSNTRGLPLVYNEQYESLKNSKYEWLVFVHDDVFIDDLRLAEKLNCAHYDHGFGIVGLAGCKNPTLKQHNLWHLMAERHDLFGAVAHPAGKDQQMVTCFGPSPEKVVLIDGLFIAVHVPTVRKTAWKFNENYTFHHYDLSSSLDANKCRIKVGVYPINVLHTSPGLMDINDPVWNASNNRFYKEYSQTK